MCIRDRLLGFGWAKPVPVNPANYRNYRRDDLKVSLAGIAMNLLLFLAGFLAASVMVFIAIRPLGANYTTLIRYAVSLNPDFIAATLGQLPAYIYEMLVYFVYVNISLALFNLLPVPPLDGYHVVNDLLLRRSLFASEKSARAAMGILFVLMITGLLGRGLSFAVDAVLGGAGWLTHGLFHLLGML